MFYSYVLKSLKDGKYYYGHTADLNVRLDVHNKGKVKSTKSRIPFVLHYYEMFETKAESAKRETFFKSINGYIFLKNIKLFDTRRVVVGSPEGTPLEEPHQPPFKSRRVSGFSFN